MQKQQTGKHKEAEILEEEWNKNLHQHDNNNNNIHNNHKKEKEDISCDPSSSQQSPDHSSDRILSMLQSSSTSSSSVSDSVIFFFFFNSKFNFLPLKDFFFQRRNSGESKNHSTAAKRIFKHVEKKWERNPSESFYFYFLFS